MNTQMGLLGDADPEDLRQMVEADAELPENKRRWAPLLADLLRVVEATHVRRGMTREAAFAAAVEAVAAIADFFGGRPVYIPRGDKLKQAVRDAEIWRRDNGRNQQELADEFGLALQSIYEILREQRALHQRKLQGQLFDKGTTDES